MNWGRLCLFKYTSLFLLFAFSRFQFIFHIKLYIKKITYQHSNNSLHITSSKDSSAENCMWRERHGWLTFAEPPRENSDFFFHKFSWIFLRTKKVYFFQRCSTQGLFTKKDTNLEYFVWTCDLLKLISCGKSFKSLIQIQCRPVSNYQHPNLALRRRRINQKKTIIYPWTSMLFIDLIYTPHKPSMNQFW